MKSNKKHLDSNNHQQWSVMEINTTEEEKAVE
jgi:hypothetical protein